MRILLLLSLIVFVSCDNDDISSETKSYIEEVPTIIKKKTDLRSPTNCDDLKPAGFAEEERIISSVTETLNPLGEEFLESFDNTLCSKFMKMNRIFYSYCLRVPNLEQAKTMNDLYAFDADEAQLAKKEERPRYSFGNTCSELETLSKVLYVTSHNKKVDLKDENGSISIGHEKGGLSMSNQNMSPANKHLFENLTLYNLEGEKREEAKANLKKEYLKKIRKVNKHVAALKGNFDLCGIQNVQDKYRHKPEYDKLVNDSLINFSKIEKELTK